MKIKPLDILAVICFAWAVYYIDFNKEAIKAFITGGVFTWWIMSKLK